MLLYGIGQLPGFKELLCFHCWWAEDIQFTTQQMVCPFVWDILPAFPPGATPFFPKHQKVQQIFKMFHLARLVSFIVLLVLITASWCEMTLGVCFLVLPTRLRLVASRCCWATKQMSQSRCRAPVCSCFSPPTATPFIWQSNPKQKLL